MATADEILAMAEGEENEVESSVLVIDNDLRTINIPSSVSLLGVESDDDVNRLYFRMPRHYCGFDLGEFIIRINYADAKGEIGAYLVTDKECTEDVITFSWLVGRSAVRYKGLVRFVVCMKRYEGDVVEQEYNTTIATLPVLEGLELVLTEEEEAHVRDVVDELYSLAASATESVKRAEAAAETVMEHTSNRDFRALKPSFGWIDDDGKVYFYNYLYPWAVEHNVPVMSALITQHIETGVNGWMTVEQVQEMYAAHPELISYASHTRDHVTASEMLADDMDNQFRGSKADIERWGAPCEVLVYPGGQVNDTTLPVVREHYKYGIQASGDGGDPGNRVNYPPIGTYTIKRRSLSMLSDLEKIKAEIDITIETNGMLIFMTHCNAYDSGNTDIDAELAKYTQVVEYLRSQGYDFEPPAVILDRFRNAFEVGNWSRDGAPRDYFVVGADGTVGVGKMSGHVAASVNKYKGATLPSEYPQNQVTSNLVSGDADTPINQGVLTAYVFGQNGYRTFMPSSANTLYTQIKKPDGDVWNSWVDVTRGYVNAESNNKVHAGTTPTDCPSRISVCLVASSSLIAELPEGKQGVLTTYKISTTASNTWQEWKPLAGVTKYIRKAKSNTAWNPWYKFEPVLVE